MRESFSINLLTCKNKRYGFFSISLVLFPLIETGWNLPCKQVLCIMKRLRHGKHLSMISFLPTQCMIFSTRFVVQSVEDFHSCNSIRKAAISHAKQKRQGFHPYRLTFIFSQRSGTATTGRFLYPNLCVESLRQCGLIPIMQPSNAKQKRQGFTRICASNRSASADNSNLANPSGKLLHPRKTKR